MKLFRFMAHEVIRIISLLLGLAIFIAIFLFGDQIINASNNVLLISAIAASAITAVTVEYLLVKLFKIKK